MQIIVIACLNVYDRLHTSRISVMDSQSWGQIAPLSGYFGYKFFIPLIYLQIPGLTLKDKPNKAHTELIALRVALITFPEHVFYNYNINPANTSGRA
jgi:hypothetical protein